MHLIKHKQAKQSSAAMFDPHYALLSLEGAKCLAVSYLSKRMSLLSYDSILPDSTVYLSDTHYIHHSCTLFFLLVPYLYA